MCNTDLEENLLTVEPDATVNCQFLGQTTARQRPDNDQTTGRQRLYNGQTTTRQRPDKDQTTARQRPDKDQTTARKRPDNGTDNYRYSRRDKLCFFRDSGHFLVQLCILNIVQLQCQHKNVHSVQFDFFLLINVLYHAVLSVVSALFCIILFLPFLGLPRPSVRYL